MADPPRNTPASSPSRFMPRRPGRRVQPDRRIGVSEIVRHFLEETRSTSEPRTLLDALISALRVVIPITAVELASGRVLPSMSPLSRPPLVIVPIAGSPSDRTNVLHIRTAAGYTPDRWDLDVLQTVVRVFGALSDRAGCAAPGSGARRIFESSSSRTVPLLGASEPMVALRRAIERFAVTDFTVLIQGESGTGKELVARALHEQSRWRHGPFIAVNCAALVDSLLEAELFGIEDRAATGVQGRAGKFELADGGTLFLDEIADLSKRAQAALLRAIQSLTIERVGGHRSRHVDTRLVVATNQPLARLVARRKFRVDLFYRLSGLEIVLPPLRERPPDILTLAAHFLTLHGAHRHTLSQPVIDALVAYAWAGNVRELERVIQRALAWTDGPEIQLEALPMHVQRRDDVRVDASLRAWTARHVLTVLQQCGGNKRLACRRLGITYHTLRAYVAKCRSLRRAA